MTPDDALTERLRTAAAYAVRSQQTPAEMADAFALSAAPLVASALAEAEQRGRREGIEAVIDLHTDSPMGPCPVCIDGENLLAGGDGHIDWPCPTLRLLGVMPLEPEPVTSGLRRAYPPGHGLQVHSHICVCGERTQNCPAMQEWFARNRHDDVCDGSCRPGSAAIQCPSPATTGTGQQR